MKTKKALLFSALRQAFPIVLGYMPVALAYGVLARQSGISAVNTVLMSFLVYAGSSQLIAVGLLTLGATPLGIVATTFVVNMRHLLMSAALAPYLRDWKRGEVCLFGVGITDETFVVHAGRFARGETSPFESCAINIISHVAWGSGALLGVAASGMITDVTPIGLDYALPAMFIGLLVTQLKSKIHALVAVSAGIASTGLLFLGMEQTHVLIATVAAATLGLGVYVVRGGQRSC